MTQTQWQRLKLNSGYYDGKSIANALGHAKPTTMCLAAWRINDGGVSLSFIYLHVLSYKHKEGLPSLWKYDFIINYNVCVSFNEGSIKGIYYYLKIR